MPANRIFQSPALRVGPRDLGEFAVSKQNAKQKSFELKELTNAVTDDVVLDRLQMVLLTTAQGSELKAMLEMQEDLSEEIIIF